MQAADIIKSRKQNQSSLQIAASSIIENNLNGRPSVGGSGQGLPSKFGDKKGFEIGGQLHYHTDGDSYSQQNLEDSGQLNGEVIVDKNTDDYKVDMKKGNSNILVAVRCRPLSTKEKQKQSQRSVKILDEKIVILSDISAAKPEEAFRQARPKDKTYAFDYAFDETIEQQYIFDRTTKFLIEGIMQGYNASVFAYGATGAGKTYTMLGSEENPGIMMISIEELFRSIMDYSSERDYKLKVSYVEVYNENIKDLLTERDEYLDLREDQVKGVCVAGVTEIMTTNVEEITKYIRQGNKSRTKERTDANEASSRSHAVLQITVEHKDKAHGISAEINIAKLSLIDLAGSERASNTNNRGLRLVEGANINRSLLALGNCINALCESTKMGPIAQKNQHIPYRDSKLTRLLKDSLGGNCRTVMITNISPAFAAYEDTLNTLKYADRAKQIKTVVKRNVLNVQFHISNYTKIINQLREEIVALRTQLSQSSGVPTISQKLNSNPTQNNPGGMKGGQQNIQAQNKLKAMKIEMNLQFEKEVTIKKEIYELDMKNEDLAFKLFSKQLYITKNKNKGPAANQSVEQEILVLKGEIDGNGVSKSQLNKRLVDLEVNRNKMLEEYQQEMLQYEIDAIDVLYNQHLLNLKQIDIKRKENRAEFHIKQRDNYINHLKEQLALRDRIIKEKLGISMTNFMPNSNGTHQVDGGHEILTMQDIDRMSKELILPSLNMTKSSSFIPNNYQFSLDSAMNGESPYSQNINLNVSPNQSAVDELQGIANGYSNKIKFNSMNKGNAYSDSGRNQTGASQKSQSLEQNQNQHQSAVDKHKYKSPKDLQSQQDQNINLSFQSHRNNSNGRLIGNQKNFNSNYSLIQNNNVQNQQSQPLSKDNQDQKSFAGEMSKNKQKFMLMNKQIIQEPGDVFSTQAARGIPKNPVNIDQKLSLLKRRTNKSKGDDPSSLQSSRNQLQQNSGGTRIPSSIIQQNGSQIVSRKTADHQSASKNSVNNSLINIVDNHA